MIWSLVLYVQIFLVSKFNCVNLQISSKVSVWFMTYTIRDLKCKILIADSNFEIFRLKILGTTF